MALHYRTQGFIFKKADRGEADQLLTIYTKDFGKLDILGRAIRKIKSKLRSGADLFYFSEIEFIQGKAYKTLTDAILIDKFSNIRNNLERLKILNQITEDADNLIGIQGKDEKIWGLITEIFNKLNSAALTLKDYSLIYYYFIWNLLSILGYQIDLYNCAICQKKLFPQKLYFNISEGGIIDFNCFQKIKKGKEIMPEAIKIARILLRNDWQILERLKIDESYKKSLEAVSEDYISSYKKSE